MSALTTDWTTDPVHDLRVALRRCRSMADGLRALDPDPSWKQMRKAGKQLFSALGDLRDVQVMEEWVGKLGAADDPVTQNLLRFLASRESQLKLEAARALQQFDRKQWKKWCRSLPSRMTRFRPGSLVFQHLALERWHEAHELHRRALRDRSAVALHRLRIGLKHFRYIVENFLPERHEAWGRDLKQLQDLLGEVHDLDVVWQTAQQAKAFPEIESRVRWHKRIIEERNQRIETYRNKMVGEHSLWPVWRQDLPQGKQVEAVALQRLKLWAGFFDPDFKHSNLVSRLALQLYDGLPAHAEMNGNGSQQREILRMAALLHDVGRSKSEKGHHKKSVRLIGKWTVPLGLRSRDLRLASAIARYHRGALPRTGQKTLAGLSAGQRAEVDRLAGILRFANAFDANHRGRIRRVKVESQGQYFRVAAEGYSARDRMADDIAGARHLLELIYRKPILVKAMRATPHPRRPAKQTKSPRPRRQAAA